jgi:cytidylate kinase
MVAERLGWLYLDTGAMYRAMAVKVLRRGIPLDDTSSIGRLAGEMEIVLHPSDDGTRVCIDGEDVTSDLRTPEIDRCVGPVCEVPEVREAMVALQRRIGGAGNVIAEGRDMGTVVFPDADLKFFMLASLESRAERRRADLARQGIEVLLEDVMSDIRRRDQRDAGRPQSPLKKAKDAVIIDTTHMSIQEQVDFVVEHIHRVQTFE